MGQIDSYVCQLTGSVTGKGGGVSRVVIDMSGALEGAGIRSPVIGTYRRGEALSSSSVEVCAFESQLSHGFSYSREMYDRVIACKSINLVHLHGLWQYSSIICNRWHQKTAKPYVVSPHGMLDPWALRNSKGKKHIANVLFQRTNLKYAFCFHALNQSEYESIRAFGLSQPVAIIPNGVSVPRADAVQPKPGDAASGRRKLLFLGRLHPKKGVDVLIRAWANIPMSIRGQWELVVAGWGENSYERYLRGEVKRLAVEESVSFVGSKFDAEKHQLFLAADGFVLPSFSEGLPMTVLEAWSYKLPVLMSRHCNLEEAFALGAANEINVSNNGIVESIAAFLSLTDADRKAAGSKGYELILSKYNWNPIGLKFKALYKWVLGASCIPDFVRLD